MAGCSVVGQFVSANPDHEPLPSQSPKPLDNFIAARRLAWDAAVMVQHPPHPAATWQEARVKWRQAIHLLEEISGDPTMTQQAKEKLAVYRSNYEAISQRLTMENAAAEHFTTAQQLAWQSAVTVQNPPHQLPVWQRASQKWQEAIALLETIPNTASVFPKSQQKLAVYRDNYRIINQRVAIETQAMSTLQQFSNIATFLNSLPSNAVGSTTDKVGIRYDDYANRLHNLEVTLDQLASVPGGKTHPVYAHLAAAIADYQFALTLWQSYLRFKEENSQWLYNEPFNQVFPASSNDSEILAQKYQVKTFLDDTRVSLRFSVWAIWQHAGNQVRTAQQKALGSS